VVNQERHEIQTEFSYVSEVDQANGRNLPEPLSGVLRSELDDILPVFLVNVQTITARNRHRGIELELGLQGNDVLPFSCRGLGEAPGKKLAQQGWARRVPMRHPTPACVRADA